MTRAGSIGFGLVLLVGCGPQTPAQTPPPRTEPLVAPVALPPTASIEVISVPETSHPLPEGAPAALAYLPADFDRSAPYDLVIFLHGWSGCIEVLIRPGRHSCVGGEAQDGWDLGEVLSASQRVLLMPQLAFRLRDGDPGRFADAEYTRRWLDNALTELNLSAPRATVLMPHSAGFEAALAWAQSGVSIDAIFLMDALYAKAPDFYAWASAEEARVLITFYTGGSTGRQSRRLARMAERDGISARVRRIRTRARHALVPSVEGPGALNEFFQDSHHGPGIDTGD